MLLTHFLRLLQSFDFSAALAAVEYSSTASRPRESLTD